MYFHFVTYILIEKHINNFSIFAINKYKQYVDIEDYWFDLYLGNTTTPHVMSCMAFSVNEMDLLGLTMTNPIFYCLQKVLK